MTKRIQHWYSACFDKKPFKNKKYMIFQNKGTFCSQKAQHLVFCIKIWQNQSYCCAPFLDYFPQLYCQKAFYKQMKNCFIKWTAQRAEGCAYDFKSMEMFIHVQDVVQDLVLKYSWLRVMCNFPGEGIDFLLIRYLCIQLSGNGFLRGWLLKDFVNQ